MTGTKLGLQIADQSEPPRAEGRGPSIWRSLKQYLLAQPSQDSATGEVR